jgi:hypothetical protein
MAERDREAIVGVKDIEIAHLTPGHFSNWSMGDDVSVCRQPIKLLISQFARTNSPGGKQASDTQN